MRYKVIQNFVIKKFFENVTLTHKKALAIPKIYSFKKNDIVISNSQSGSLGTMTTYKNITQNFSVTIWDTEYSSLDNIYAQNPYTKYLKFISYD